MDKKNNQKQIKESEKKREMLNEAKALIDLNSKLRTQKKRLAIRLA